VREISVTISPETADSGMKLSPPLLNCLPPTLPRLVCESVHNIKQSTHFVNKLLRLALSPFFPIIRNRIRLTSNRDKFLNESLDQFFKKEEQLVIW
jgi:hypothetical protein